MGDRAMCLLCVSMTRHEYGVDTNLHALANDGIRLGNAPGSPPPAAEGPFAVRLVKTETSVDIFACFGSSSVCSKFAMMLETAGRKSTREDFRSEGGPRV